jgi:Tat protein secretion system quality control protein TatD with DNase activity
VVKKFPDLKVYFHCRGYTTKELEILHSWKLATGNRKLFVGFCGNITYPKAQELRDCFQYCLDHDIKVLLETDAPYLAAQAIRGQQNTPANIIYTYDYVSDYFQIQKDKLKELTYNNFMELYFE